MINTISVFCGSGSGTRQAYTAAARELGVLLAGKNIRLVYGGGKRGLMGVIAETMLNNGGRVTGVIPRALADKEVAYTDLHDLRIVGSMHERKAAIARIADAFIALPVIQSLFCYIQIFCITVNTDKFHLVLLSMLR